MVGWINCNCFMVTSEVCNMSKTYAKLLKLKDELKDKPKQRRRVISILMRRYDYGIDEMEQYRWGDFRDEIMAVKR